MMTLGTRLIPVRYGCDASALRDLVWAAGTIRALPMVTDGTKGLALLARFRRRRSLHLIDFSPFNDFNIDTTTIYLGRFYLVVITVLHQPWKSCHHHYHYHLQHPSLYGTHSHLFSWYVNVTPRIAAIPCSLQPPIGLRGVIPIVRCK